MQLHESNPQYPNTYINRTFEEYTQTHAKRFVFCIVHHGFQILVIGDGAEAPIPFLSLCKHQILGAIWESKQE